MRLLGLIFKEIHLSMRPRFAIWMALRLSTVEFPSRPHSTCPDDELARLFWRLRALSISLSHFTLWWVRSQCIQSCTIRFTFYSAFTIHYTLDNIYFTQSCSRWNDVCIFSFRWMPLLICSIDSIMQPLERTMHLQSVWDVRPSRRR